MATISSGTTWVARWGQPLSRSTSSNCASVNINALASPSSAMFSGYSSHALLNTVPSKNLHRQRGFRLIVRANSDYYSVLGVSKNASKSDIKSAYRKLAGINHLNVNKRLGKNDVDIVLRLTGDPKGTSVKRREVRSRQQCRCISYKDGVEHSRNKNEEKKEEEKEGLCRAILIWRAIKLPIYTVALVPLTVGSAAAYLQTGHYSARRYFMLLASSVFIITWLNLSNDVYDFDTGADKNKKESVVNIVGMRTGTLIAACLLLAFGFLGLAWVSAVSGNVRPLLLLACAIACGYVYQCPPFRLSYQGLGEPLCLAAFGPFATTAFYLLQSTSSELPITWTIFSASLLVGLTTTLILFCSHFHQVKEDIAVEKMSPLVRLGRQTGSQVVKMAVIALYSLLFVFGLSRALPFSCILVCALTIPIGKLVVNYVEENHKDNSKIFMAKYYCVRLHTLFGAALAAGLVASRVING